MEVSNHLQTKQFMGGTRNSSRVPAWALQDKQAGQDCQACYQYQLPGYAATMANHTIAGRCQELHFQEKRERETKEEKEKNMHAPPHVHTQMSTVMSSQVAAK